jgi:hypothetical protein
MAQESFMNQAEAQKAWEDLRASKAFPAIVGGLAGASIGLALLFIGSRMRAPKKSLPAAYDANGEPMNIVYLPAPSQPRILGFTVGDLIALGTAGLTIFRQMQDVVQGQKAGTDGADASYLPPSPADMPKASHKKK